jgi:hypothetical protein
VSGSTYDVTGELLKGINAGVKELMRLAYRSDQSHAFQNEALMESLYELRELTDRQRITSEAVEDLRLAVQQLGPNARQVMVDLLVGANSSAGVALLLKLLGVPSG